MAFVLLGGCGGVVGLVALARKPVPGPRWAAVSGRTEQALAFRDQGDALHKAGRLADAAAAYRSALDLDPQDATAFLGLVHSVPWDDDLSDIQRRFGKLDDPYDAFERCAAACEERPFPHLLEQLVEAMRRVDRNYPPLDYYLALCKARTNQPVPAVRLFRSALDKQPNAREREGYVKGFMKAMASAGKFEEAYAAAPDERAAFRWLASEGIRTYRSDELRRLVALHGKKHADDPMLPWFQAEIYVQQQRYARADETFAAALAHPPDDETLNLFRSSRVLACYHTGHALDAYRDIGPRQETFLQLARLAFQDGKDDELQALLVAHSKNEPDSIELVTYRARLMIRQNNVPVGTALIRSALAKLETDEKREDALYEFLSDLVSAGKAVEGYRAAPDAKQAFTIVADELFEQERLEDLPQLITAHREREPLDPWLDYYQGEVLLDERAWDKAAAVLAEGCKKAPPQAQDRFRQQYVFAMYKAGRGMQAYEESPARDQAFLQLAGLLAGDKLGADLERLVEAHRPHAARSDPGPYLYDSRAKIFLKQPTEATAYFRKACDLQPNEALRAGYVTQFLLDMTEAGYIEAAYQAMPADKAGAFQTLAARLVFRKKDKDLATLLNLHRKGHDKDPWYQFYTGELHLLRGEAQQAEQHFAAALANSPRDENWSLRNGLFRARVKGGKAVTTYREYKPGVRTFEDLAGLCVHGKDAKQLQALIDAHRKDDPDDPSLPAWELEVKYLNADYDGVLKLLADNQDELFGMPRWRWKADDYRVRCLVKLKRTKDAIHEAETVAKKPAGSRLLLVLAYAAAGDAKQTIAALEKKRPQPWFLSSCYKDPDLGPILRSESFKEFREKFPEPADDEFRGGQVPDD
jgi:predicted Zn-dependent protease